MVAHLGVIATSLSYNFARCGEGCTNDGESDYNRYRSYCNYVSEETNVVLGTGHFALGCRAIFFVLSVYRCELDGPSTLVCFDPAAHRSAAGRAEVRLDSWLRFL